MTREPPDYLDTERLRLRRWTTNDYVAFAEMNADEEVMRDQGGPIPRQQSDDKLDRYAAAFEQFGYGRWLVESRGRETPTFLGYVGVMPVRGQHPLGDHDEVGWRFHRSAWGKGFATEAALAALHDVFTRVGLPHVLAYTSPDNLRSQAVMERLALRRDESLDFVADYDGFAGWPGLVWVADKP